MSKAIWGVAWSVLVACQSTTMTGSSDGAGGTADGLGAGASSNAGRSGSTLGTWTPSSGGTRNTTGGASGVSQSAGKQGLETPRAGAGTGGPGGDSGAGTAGVSEAGTSGTGEAGAAGTSVSLGGTSGTGVNPTTGGAAGGGAVPPACSQAADCGSLDATHCNCVDAGGGQCVVQAKDADGDGYGDIGCTAAGNAANDCDDANRAVHPGAAEICDGLDNNCNGSADLDDGLTPEGKMVVVAEGASNASQANITWLSASKAYGMTWQAADRVWFRRMSSTGELLGEAFQVNPLDSANSSQSVLALAAGDGEFGLLYRENTTEGAKLYFQRVPGQGNVDGNRVQLGGTWTDTTELLINATLQLGEGGKWFAFFSDGTNSVRGAGVRGTHQDATGDFSARITVAPAGIPRSAKSADQVGLLIGEGASGKANISLFATDLSPQVGPALDQLTGLPVIGGGPPGYGLLAHTGVSSNNWQFREISREGSVTCGPVAVPAGTLPGNSFVSSIAPFGNGWLLGLAEAVSMSASGPVVHPALQRIGAGCTVKGDLVRMTDAPMAFMDAPIVAASSSGVAAAWTRDGSVTAYVFGPWLCK